MAEAAENGDRVVIDCTAFFNEEGIGAQHRGKNKFRYAVAAEWRKTPCEVNKEDFVGLLHIWHIDMN